MFEVGFGTKADSEGMAVPGTKLARCPQPGRHYARMLVHGERIVVPDSVARTLSFPVEPCHDLLGRDRMERNERSVRSQSIFHS